VTTGTQTTPRDFRFHLPADWVRISLDDKAEQAVVRIVDRQLDKFSAAQRDGMRHALVRQLSSAVADARTAGGIDLIVGLGTSRGLPIGGSCLVLPIDIASSTVAGLLDELQADGAQTTMLTIGGGSAVRRRTRTVHRIEDAASRQEIEDALAPVPVVDGARTQVDYFVPLPPGAQFLLFSFGTVIDPIADAMVDLFDAIMSTLRWVT
jgi:hypothetical protein